jgi:hypothetical protein
VIALACAGLVLVGCGAASPAPTAPAAPASSAAADTGASPSLAPAQEDAAALLARALAVQAADSAQFAALVSAAAAACGDPDAARRLGTAAVTAARWSAALQEGRPKAQAVTEAQLARVDWEALGAACRRT